MREYPKNIPASIHARLADKAKKLNKPFGELLQHYGMERILYRLSKTKYAGSFILKGGLIFTFWNIPLRRPTRDIDFLVNLDNSKGIIYEVLKAAILISMPEDGVIFDISTLTLEMKQIDSANVGIRALFLGYLGRAEIPIQIDFGFSDEISSPIKNISYPTLLEGIANPLLNVYPPEAVVAEKFHAMQRFVERPSRWKDYYDVWLISENFGFEDILLQKAIFKTFENRATEIPTTQPPSLSAKFAFDYDVEWKRFYNKNYLENIEIRDLPQLIGMIWNFLKYPLMESAIQNSKHENRFWQPTKREWES